MPGRSWLADLRTRLGGGARADGLGILAFEAAAAMSRLVSLHVALSDAEVRRLRGDALRAEGVTRLTSTDQAFLLRLACAELVADLDRAADAAARLGARCGAGDGAATPLLRDFDRVYADAKRGRLAQLDAAVGYSRGAARRFREMERHVAATARLYAEMDALGELEASERRMEQWMRHSGPIPARSTPGKGPAAAAAGEPGEKLLRELRAQRHKVRRLMDASLWSVPAAKAAKLMAKSVLAVLARISTAFGASVPGLPPLAATGGGRAWALGGHSSGPLHRAAAAPDAAIRHSAPIDPAINLPGFAFHKALKARKKLVSVLQGVLNQRRAAAAKGLSGSGRDMVDRLIEVEDEHGRRLDDEQIIDILIMYLNAGHESSGHITMWATLFLQENPEIFAKAKAEQEEIVRSIPSTQKGLNLRDFRKMKYLSQVIDETLRFVNISFVSFREATKDVSVNGYLIPKGWKVQLWYRSVHMDPEVYPDPRKFNPSRWEGYLPKPGTFLPFGLGTKLCPGNDLAKLEISVFLHHFLLGYKLTRTNPNCRIRYLPHPRPVDNCLAKITKVSDG